MTEFRTITGEENNLENPQLGSEKTNLIRLFEVFYEDGFNSPRVTDSNGNPLPNPRTISNIVVAQTELISNYLNATDWLWQWGQFIDHDLTLNEGSPSSPPEDFIPIPVPQDNLDDLLVQEGTTQLPFIRSVAAEGTGTALGNPRLQVNEITHFIDASSVYGSNIEVATALRDPNGGGRLLTQTNLLSTGVEELLPFQSETEVPAADPVGLSPEQTFVAGDVRVNEQLGLNGIHTLFAREHNRIAKEIEVRLNNGDGEILAQFNNSGLSEDDFIYESARKVVGAKIQIITYNEFLPLLIGSQFHPVDQVLGGGFGITSFTGYDPTIDPSISSEFANAAYRLGHTLLSPEVQRVEQNGIRGIFIGDAFFDSQQIYDQSNYTGLGVNSVYSGLALQASQEYDNQIVDGLRNFLFNEVRGGLDLASVNIARGREVGLPTLNQARQLLGLTPYTSFNEISSKPGVAERFASAYDSVNDIDLWVGGIAEDAVNGGLLGETFNLIVSDQFQRLRDGDRFFYLNELDELTVLAPDLEHTSLSGVIRDNTPESLIIQDNAFILPYENKLVGTDVAEMLFGGNKTNLIEGLGGDDTLQGGNDDDIIFGGSGNDLLRGDNGLDTLLGGEGNDTLNGLSGDDLVLGGDGNDAVRGGRGADLLTGGNGLDTFVIKGDEHSGAYGKHSDLHFDVQGKVIFDRILDFNVHEDVLVLEDMRVNGLDSVHYDSLTGDIILTDTVNGEVTSSHVIAQLQPSLNLEIQNQGHGNWIIL